MKLQKYLPIIGILIFLYILFKLNISEILKEFANVKIAFLLIAGFFVLILLFAETFKWFVIARVQTTKIPFREAFKINIIGLFYAFITPSKLGGIIRAEYLKKYNNQKRGKGLSNYVLDKVLDICSLIFMTLIFSFVFKNLIPISFSYYFLIIFILLITALVVFRDEKKSRALLRIFYKKFIPDRIKEKTKESFYSFYENMPNKKYFGLFFLFNLLNWIAGYTVSYFVGLSLGISISFFYFLAILPIATLVGQIPITISGLGTREAVMISFFGILGVGATKVFSMSIITLFISGVLPSLIASFLIIKEKEKV